MLAIDIDKEVLLIPFVKIKEALKDSDANMVRVLTVHTVPYVRTVHPWKVPVHTVRAHAQAAVATPVYMLCTYRTYRYVERVRNAQ